MIGLWENTREGTTPLLDKRSPGEFWNVVLLLVVGRPRSGWLTFMQRAEGHLVPGCPSFRIPDSSQLPALWSPSNMWVWVRDQRQGASIQRGVRVSPDGHWLVATSLCQVPWRVGGWEDGPGAAEQTGVSRLHPPARAPASPGCGAPMEGLWVSLLPSPSFHG